MVVLTGHVPLNKKKEENVGGVDDNDNNRLLLSGNHVSVGQQVHPVSSLSPSHRRKLSHGRSEKLA